MSKEIVILVRDDSELEGKLVTAYGMLKSALRAGAAEFVLRRPGKTRVQEEKYHAMISDIHRQCFRGYSAEGVKAVLVNQFAIEMEEAGTPLAHPGEKVWDWKSQEAVYVRPTTTKFSKGEAAQFIEYLYSEGTGLGVNWSEPALAVYEEYREAKEAA